MFIATLYIIAKTRNQPKCPSTEEWIKKMYIQTMEHFSVIKKNEVMPFVASWVDLQNMILSEISHTQKDKYHDITHMWNLISKKKDTNELAYKTEADLKVSKMNLWLPKGKCVSGDKSGTWHEHRRTNTYKMGNQQRPII